MGGLGRAGIAMAMDTLVWSPFIAFAASALATLACREIARRTGMVAHPGTIVPTHTTDVATMGGVGIAAGMAAAALAMDLAVPLGLAAGAASFLLLGLVDDAVALPWRVKLTGQVILAAAAVWLGAGGSWHPAVATLWIVILVNAVNLTDVCDGLAGGVAVPAFVACAWLVPAQASLALAAAAACLGFLVHNLPPAAIYLGDAGAHLIGFLLAALTLLQPGDAGSAAVRSGLLGGVFLFELLFLCAMRLRRRQAPWIASPDHFSLRLQANGWTRLRVDLSSWTAGAVLAGIAATCCREVWVIQPLTGGVLVFATVATWRHLARLEPR